MGLEVVEVVMRQWCLNVLAVFALLAFPLAGCSGSDNGGAGYIGLPNVNAPERGW